jgi:hypothetical protein
MIGNSKGTDDTATHHPEIKVPAAGKIRGYVDIFIYLCGLSTRRHFGLGNKKEDFLKCRCFPWCRYFIIKIAQTSKKDARAFEKPI